MTLTQKEMTAVKDLQTQEEGCMKKYADYEKRAKDTELKRLFATLKQSEQMHYDSLGQVLNGTVPKCDCNDTAGRDYEPKATYGAISSSDDKEADSYLVTDCIGTEKLISGEYNSNVFNCDNTELRKLLADIQIEEQNHAEMMYKYKQANSMK